MASVLVCGVYLADHPNLAANAKAEFDSSALHQVEQRWAAIAENGDEKSVLPGTALISPEKKPKFELLNAVMGDFSEFDFVLICDDDISLRRGFLDDFVALVDHCQFDLAQPARTWSSYWDHAITLQLSGVIARQTRFVEIGPLFIIRASAFDGILPFDVRSPMGWGLDYVWPATLERRSLRLGIVDATPVEHSARRQTVHYDRGVTDAAHLSLLEEMPHLTPNEAHRVIDVFGA